MQRPPLDAPTRFAVIALALGGLLPACAPEAGWLHEGAEAPGKADGYGQEASLNEELLAMALAAAELARSEGRGLGRPHVLTIVDFSLSSAHKRLWVLDTRTNEVLLHERVAHGRNSGDELHARSFSNVFNSYQSSLGLFEVNETGVGGSVGPYVALDGLEPGFNDRARAREILVHGASYASDDHYLRNGSTGRSLGCFSVRPDVIRGLMRTIEGGSLLFAYYPNESYLASSRYASNSPITPWVGTLCEPGDDETCSFSYGSAEGFCFDEGGFCVLGCEGTCPDRYGHAATFCIEGPDGGGMCVSKAEAANGHCTDIPGTRAETRVRYLGASGASARTAEVCVPVD